MLGYTRALIKGIETSKSDLVARMDADDIAVATRLETQVRYLREHPDCVVVGGLVMIIDADGDPVCLQRYPLSHAEIDSHHLHGKGACVGPSSDYVPQVCL